jgi:hypothetical protein
VPGVATIALDPLDEAASRRLLVAAAGSRGLTEAELRARVSRAAGNPLFLRELAYADAADGVIPETVERVLAGRIDLLEPVVRIRLREASVAGSSADLGLLARALDRPELADAATWRGVEEFATVEGGVLRFTHDLARAVAYEGLAHARRRTVHAAIAGELVGRAGSADDRSALLAFHWSQAAVWGEAWEWGNRAVARAVADAAPADAYSLARHTLDAGRRLPHLAAGELAALTETAGDLANRIGRLDDAHSAYARARVLAAGDPPARARLARKRGDVAEKEGRFRASLQWYRRGLRELDGAPAGAEPERAATELWLAYAATLSQSGRNGESRTLTAEVLPAAERVGGEVMAQAYLQLATATALLDRPDGEPYASRAAEVITAAGDDLRFACLHLNLGVAHVEANRFSIGVGHYEAAEAAFSRCGDEVGAALAEHNRGEVLSLLGDPAAAERFADALRRFRASGYRVGELLAASGLGRSALFAGDGDAARQWLEEAWAGFTLLGHRSFALDTELRLAEVALRTGAVEEAAARLAAVGSDPDDPERRGFYPVWHDRLHAAVLARGGRAAEADRLLASVVARADAAGLMVEAATALDARIALGVAPDRDALAARRDAIVADLGVVELLTV